MSFLAMVEMVKPVGRWVEAPQAAQNKLIDFF
jgi:hypothetical protein